MAKREFEVIVTRTGSQDEREQAYQVAIHFFLSRLPEYGKLESKRQTDFKLKIKGAQSRRVLRLFICGYQPKSKLSTVV